MFENTAQVLKCSGVFTALKIEGDTISPEQVFDLEDVSSISTSGSTKGIPLKVDGVQYYIPVQTAVAKFDYLSVTTPGVVEASKAVVVGANKNIDTLIIADGGLKLGSGAGTAVSATAAELNVLASVTAGTASASKGVVLDSAKGVVGLGRLTQGAFNSNTQGSGLVVNPANTSVLRTYADDAGVALTPTGAVPDLRVSLARYLITADQSAINARVWGQMGQVKIYDTLFNNEQCGGVNGRLEIVQSAGTTALAGYGFSSGVCGILATAGTVLINTSHVAAAVSAVADLKGTLTQTGQVVGFHVGVYNTAQWSDGTARAKFKTGLYIAYDAAHTGIRVGNWVGSAALGAAVPFTVTQDIYSDGQLDVIAAFGESTADLTSAYSAKVGRYRHVINGITCNHEAYGLIGQVVAKNVTYAHLHAGLMGTFEVNTAATVSAGDAVGCAAVIGRVGGATITVGATGFLTGIMSAQLATVVSITSGGVHAAFACRKVGAGITWAEALHIEDALVAIRFKAADNDYAHGIKAVVDTPDTTTTHALKVMIGTTAGYIPVYANETFGA